MTNAELIAKIKTEIERRWKDYRNSVTPDQPKYRTHYFVGKGEVCEELLSFLDTLEEPVCEELEEAAKNYENSLDYHHYTGDNPSVAFIAGAKWQAEQLLKSSPLPEDTVLFNKGVEEGRRMAEEEQADLFTIVALDAAQRERKKMLEEGLDAIRQNSPDKIEKTIAGVFVKYGMDRMKQEMLKEAVEGKVFMSFAPGHNQMVMADVDLPTNTEVRVIVLPKQDKK